jgi:hypothetical protein
MEKIIHRVRAMPLSPGKIVHQIDQDFKGLVLVEPCTEKKAWISPGQIPKPAHLRVVEVHDKEATRNEATPDRCQAGELVGCGQDVLEGVTRDDRQAKGFVQVEGSHVALHPTHVAHARALVPGHVEHSRGEIEADDLAPLALNFQSFAKVQISTV